MAGLADVVAHFDDQLDVATALLERLDGARTSLLDSDFDVLLQVRQVLVNPVDLLLPLEWIYASLQDLLVVCLVGDQVHHARLYSLI